MGKRSKYTFSFLEMSRFKKIKYSHHLFFFFSFALAMVEYLMPENLAVIHFKWQIFAI